MKIPEQKIANPLPNKTIRVNDFEYISKWSNHGIPSTKYGNTYSDFDQLKSADERGQIYKNKGLALIEETIHKFLKYYYITVIKKLTFSLSHVQILGKWM